MPGAAKTRRDAPMSDHDLEATVQALSDKDAIRDLTARYADCVWRHDPDGAVELFTDDGVMDVGNGTVLEGRDALRDGYRAMLTVDLQPFVHGHVIELDGDRASGRCYLDLRGTMGGKSMTGVGFYEDRYVRTARGWKFQARKLVMRFFGPHLEGWAERPGEK